MDPTRSVWESRHLRGATVESILGEWHVAKWKRGLCPLGSSSAPLCGTFVSSIVPSYPLTSVSHRVWWIIGRYSWWMVLYWIRRHWDIWVIVWNLSDMSVSFCSIYPEGTNDVV
jgi:hypothetical protein